MRRSTTSSRVMVQAAAGLALGLLITSAGAAGTEPRASSINPLRRGVEQIVYRARHWYQSTAPMDRMIWGGLAACAGLGLGVVTERLTHLRRRRIFPPGFAERLLGR